MSRPLQPGHRAVRQESQTRVQGSLCDSPRGEDHCWLPVRSASGVGPPLRGQGREESPQHEAQPAGGVRAQRRHL